MIGALIFMAAFVILVGVPALWGYRHNPGYDARREG